MLDQFSRGLDRRAIADSFGISTRAVDAELKRMGIKKPPVKPAPVVVPTHPAILPSESFIKPPTLAQRMSRR